MLKIKVQGQPFGTMAHLAIIGLFVLAFFYTVYLAQALLLPVALAVFLALVLRPLVRALKRVGIAHRISAFGILVVCLAMLSGTATLVYQPAVSWADRIPEITRTIERKLSPVKKTIDQAKKASRDLERATRVGIEKTQPVLLREPSLLDRVLGFTWATIVQGLITLVLCFFLLAESGGSWSNRALRGISPAVARDLERSINAIERNIGRYLSMLALTNLIVGILTSGALYLIGMPNPFLWGAVAALLGLLPYVGPIITMALLAAVSLTIHDDWLAALAPVGAFATIHYTMSELVMPIIVGRALRLSPVAVFLSVLLWSWLWGVAGAFLAVPILVTVSASLKLRALRESEDRSPANSLADATSDAVPAQPPLAVGYRRS